MKTIEEVIKKKASFFPLGEDSGIIINKEMINPEVYSLDFLKEKIKEFCYFLASISNENLTDIYIFLLDKYSYEIHKPRYCYSPAKFFLRKEIDKINLMSHLIECSKNKKIV